MVRHRKFPRTRERQTDKTDKTQTTKQKNPPHVKTDLISFSNAGTGSMESNMDTMG